MKYIPSIFKSDKEDRLFRTFYLNTNTILDIVTGNFKEGVVSYKKLFSPSQFILDGGISPTFSIVGKPQSYKSTLTLSYISRILRLYKDSTVFVYDSELAIPDEDRIIDIGHELDEYITTSREDMKERIILKNKNDLQMEELFEKIREIATERETHIKDYIVESPFIDIKTNKPIKTVIPFIVVIDSFSKMSSSMEETMMGKHRLTDSELNTMFMRDGLNKSKFMTAIPSFCKKAGMYFITTAHLGKKTQMNPFEPVTRDLQFMNMNESVKSVGSQFNYLINTMIKANKVTCLRDTNKKVMYPANFKTSDLELNLCDLMLCRCKYNISGVTLSPIISQNFGILEGISNYHILKNNGLYGMKGSKVNQKIILAEKYSISRTKIRDSLKNYELYRALEILNHLYTIYSYWPLNKPWFKILNEKDIDGISDMLVKNKKLSINKILNSRGYWTYHKVDRQYLSIIDILTILNNE